MSGKTQAQIRFLARDSMAEKRKGIDRQSQESAEIHAEIQPFICHSPSKII